MNSLLFREELLELLTEHQAEGGVFGHPYAAPGEGALPAVSSLLEEGLPSGEGSLLGFGA